MRLEFIWYDHFSHFEISVNFKAENLFQSLNGRAIDLDQPYAEKSHLSWSWFSVHKKTLPKWTVFCISYHVSLEVAVF